MLLCLTKTRVVSQGGTLVLRSLQKCQGSGIVEYPVGKVDVSCEVCARMELNNWESHCAADLTDAGQRCEMSFSFGQIFNVNHTGRGMGNILIFTPLEKIRPLVCSVRVRPRGSWWGELVNLVCNKSFTILACCLLCYSHVLKLHFNTAFTHRKQRLQRTDVGLEQVKGRQLTSVHSWGVQGGPGQCF